MEVSYRVFFAKLFFFNRLVNKPCYSLYSLQIIINFDENLKNKLNEKEGISYL